METAALLSLVKQLDGNLDQLEEALGPTLEESLNATSKKLPLLDRAKLNVTVVYAIESLIFSYLKVNGVDPRTHAVFKEIERVKQYFNKVKEVEEMSTAKPSITLNKQAAARIIQHSLASNGNSDLAQREREARERLLLKRKFKAETVDSNSKANPVLISSPSTPSNDNQAAPPQQDVDMQDESSAEEGEIDEDEATIPTSQVPEENAPTLEQTTKKQKQKQKHKTGGSSKLSADRKAEKKARKKAKKEGKMAANSVSNTG